MSNDKEKILDEKYPITIYTDENKKKVEKILKDYSLNFIQSNIEIIIYKLLFEKTKIQRILHSLSIDVNDGNIEEVKNTLKRMNKFYDVEFSWKDDEKQEK